MAASKAPPTPSSTLAAYGVFAASLAKHGSDRRDLAGESVTDRFDLEPTCMTVVGADGMEMGEWDEGRSCEGEGRGVLIDSLPFSRVCQGCEYGGGGGYEGGWITTTTTTTTPASAFRRLYQTIRRLIASVDIGWVGSAQIGLSTVLRQSR